MKKWIAVLLLLMLVLPVFTACNTGKTDTDTTTAAESLTGDQALKRVLTELGIPQEEISDLQIHMGQMEESPAFSVQFTFQEQKYECIILSETGEILSNEIVG